MKFVRRWRFVLIHSFSCFFFAITTILICLQKPFISEVAFLILFVSVPILAIITRCGEEKVSSEEAKTNSLWYYFDKNSLEKEGLGYYEKE